MNRAAEMNAFLFTSFKRSEGLVVAVPSSLPYNHSAVVTNLVFRIFLGIVANLVCLVPLRILHRNGELAVVVLIILVEVKNLMTILNALIWSSSDVHSWWPGYGLCDIEGFVHNAGVGLYLTCLLAIMRNLAHSVGMLRVNPLTMQEKRRRNLIQALIIFPLPLFQAAFTWPLSAQRYAIGQVVGCSWQSYPAWPFLIFFVVIPMMAALATAIYSVITWKRFREIRKATQSALSSNLVASMRSTRTKRRLYLMVISIIVPYLPINIAFAVFNLLQFPGLLPFNYKTIRHPNGPYPWNTIALYPAQEVSWVLMVESYPAILTAIPVFLFFGMTKDALNDYRKVLVFFGFGKCFPYLYKEYDPDRKAYSGTYMGATQNRTATGSSSYKISNFGTSQTLSNTLSSSSGGTSKTNAPQSPDFLTSFNTEQGRTDRISPLPPAQLGTVNEDTTNRWHHSLTHRNPFFFRSRLDFQMPFHLPLFHSKTKGKSRSSDAHPSVLLESLPTITTAPLQSLNSQLSADSIISWAQDSYLFPIDRIETSAPEPGEALKERSLTSAAITLPKSMQPNEQC